MTSNKKTFCLTHGQSSMMFLVRQLLHGQDGSQASKRGESIPWTRIFSIPWTMEKGTHFNPEVTCIPSAHIPLASTGHVVLLRCKGGWEIEPMVWTLFSNTSTQLGVRNIILWWSAVCFCHHCYCFLFSLPCPSNIGSAWKWAEVRGWGELNASAESDREYDG